MKNFADRPCSFSYYEKVSSDNLVLIVRHSNIDYYLYFRTLCLTQYVHFGDETGHTILDSIQKLNDFLRGVPSQTLLNRTFKIVHLHSNLSENG